MTWSDYARAAQELAELRRAEEAAAADRAAVSRTAADDLDKLTRHLDAQRELLNNLATTLKLPEPWTGKADRSSVTDVAQALHLAADAANAADVQARRAEQIGANPILLPDASPTARNALIYGAWAAVGWLVQCGLVTVSQETDFGVLAWSLCGLPALAFFAGYLTVATVGQPRVGAGLPKQARLGGAICFVGMPLAWIALIAAFSFLRG
ncbi:hypothetical protein GCM10009557_18560 [Virgisporangium ochraceum]|uniref:Uncharacterized protein n=1 Tax=Virgisporangium ochraceum TaxID=65505 RepID=A0A8J3ZNZ1_9ACTN|nr:hypothetical protein [Virgisporangium ochraceum]GIJ65550.1 hypothetical protein Voc01_004670 [Virgisporangium ochraceum]